MSAPAIDITGLTKTYGRDRNYGIEFISVLYFAGLTLLLTMTSFRLYRRKDIYL